MEISNLYTSDVCSPMSNSVLISALAPLDDVFLQTMATVVANVVGCNLYLPVLMITKAPGMANPAWLQVLHGLQQHMTLVKGMVRGVCVLDVCFWTMQAFAKTCACEHT